VNTSIFPVDAALFQDYFEFAIASLSDFTRCRFILDGQGRHMAQTSVFSDHPCKNLLSRHKLYWKILIFSVFSLSLTVAAPAQTQQPFLITVPSGANEFGAVTFTRDDTTGVLTLVPNTTVTFQNPCVPFKPDPTFRFLFGNCNGGLSMYTLNGTTGVVAEVPNSPFTETTANSAVVIMAETTGQYVYIVKANYSGTISAANFTLDTFKIDPQTPALVPTSTQSLPITGSWVDSGAVGDPNGHGFAVLVNQDQGGSRPVPVLYTVTFDPSSGLPIVPTSGTSLAGVNAQGIFIGPKGKFMAVNFGANGEFLMVYQLSTSTFQPITSNTVNIGEVPFMNRGIFFDPGDSLTFVQILNPAVGEYTVFQIMDSATLSVLPSSPISFESAEDIQDGIEDPYGPFVFSAYYPTASAAPTGLTVFQVDPITGIPSQPSPINAPFNKSLSVVPMLLTATAPQQNSSSPALAWSPASVTFSSTTTGQSSGPQILTFKNTGTVPATFSSLTLTGPNASDFSINDQCTPAVILQPNSMCTVSITYAPASPGTSQATITVTDNAVGSPQMIGLTGTAVAPPPPVPAVSLNPPGPLTFPGTTTQGTSSATQNIILTNTGNGTLHVASIVVTGFNANDFVIGVSNCLGAVASSANCSIPITFAPLAAGIRTTTLVITNDASTSPQYVALNGTATPAITVAPAQNGSTSATVTAGQPASYNLQLTPGAGYTGTVSFSCTGAPVGANCQVPASLQITNGNSASFTVMVTTSGGAMMLPLSGVPRSTPFPGQLLLLAIAGIGGIFFLTFVVDGRNSAQLQRLKPIGFGGALASIIFFATLAFSGCGGGSSTTVPPQIITPNGTSTITVTPAAMSTSGKALQLTPVQLTLTVN
jgi:hypothetical protein